MKHVSRLCLGALGPSALALSGLLASACTPPAEDGAKAQGDAKPAEGASAEGGEARKMARGTGPVAKVNGEEIGRAEFDRQMDRTEARFSRAGREISAALETRLKENLIRKMVDEELIRQKAVAEGISVTKEELDAKFAEHKGRFGNDKAFESFLSRTNQTEADIKADLEKTALREKLFAKMSSSDEPSEADAKTYYEENKDKYKQREQVKASHILLKVAKTDADEVKAEKLKKANEVLKKAKAAGSDFEALAKEYSEGPTAKRGGDLGKFSRGRMVKAFEDAAFAANPGDVIGPVETQFGYHIIKIFEKVPERQRDFDEVKESILTSLQARAKSKATRDVLRQLKTDAKIEVLEPGVDLDRKQARAPLGPEGGKLLPTESIQKLRDQIKARGEMGGGAPKADAPAPGNP